MRSLRWPASSRFRYTFVAALAFAFGTTASIVLAGPASNAPVFRLGDRTDDSMMAKVDAAGNVAVSVSNLPASQEISGTVNIGNSPTVKVEDARIPFQQAMSIPNWVSGPTHDVTGSFTVPTDKRLTIEYVSGYTFHVNCGGCSDDPVSNFTFTLQTTANGTSSSHYLPATQFARNPNGAGFQFLVAQPVKITADPGSTVTLTVTRYFNGYNGSSALTLSGYLSQP